jgi:type VI secretion system protein ImpH
MLAFANMLTHRLFTLLYRAWAVAQPTASYDRALRGKRGNAPPDPFERKVAALTGHMTDGLRDRDHMPDLAKRYFSGHLSNGTRHPEGLVSMLSLFVRAPVTLDEFVGEWLELEPEDRWRLGARVGLGLGTGVGSRVFTHGAKFRLRIGPVNLAEFRRLLPGGPSLDRVEDIVRNYVGDTFDWDINLILHESEVPVSTLGEGTALGHTSWIGQRRADSHADDLYLVPKSLARRRAAAGA